MKIWPEGVIFLFCSLFIYVHFVVNHLKLRSRKIWDSKPVRVGTVIGMILSFLIILSKHLIEPTDFFSIRNLFEWAGFSLALSGLIVIMLDSRWDHQAKK